MSIASARKPSRCRQSTRRDRVAPTEPASRSREEQAGQVFDAATLGISFITRDLRFIRVNAALCDLLGYTQDELLPLGVRGVSHPDDMAADADLARQAFAGDTDGYTIEKRYLTKSGETVWVNVTVRVVRDAHGAPRYGFRMAE